MKLTNSKICPVCGNEISMYSCGRKISAPNYAKRKYCSIQCKSIGQKTTQRIEHPRNKERLYHVWQGMKQRCNGSNSYSAKWYHDKGIRVCEEWLHDYEAFKEWALNNGYDDQKSRKEQSIDRIDNNKGYSPDNCRFVTHSENCKNTSSNIWLEYDGRRQVITDWSKETGLSVETLSKRIKRGLPAKDVLSSEKRFYFSNTGLKGISWQEKEQRYVVYADGHKYLGVRKELEDAIKLRNGAE